MSLKGEGLEDEKAEDAIDYEDIDEVADEDEDELGGVGGVKVKVEASDDMDMEMDLGMGGLFGEEGFGGEEGDAGVDMDGLFDEDFEVGPIDIGGGGVTIDENGAQKIYTADGILGKLSFESDTTQVDRYEYGDDLALGVLDDEPRELTKQQELALYWPEFRPHTVLNFNKLIPIKEGKYPFTVAKQPKVLLPTKVTLEPMVDTQRSFSRPGLLKMKGQEGPVNVITIRNEDDEGQEEKLKKGGSEEELDEKTLRDIEMCCDDWEAKVFPPDSPGLEPVKVGKPGSDIGEEDDTEYEIDIRPMKRPKLLHSYLKDLPADWLDVEDICDGNLHLSAKVTLDLNDPYLLVDVRQPHEIQRARRIGGDVKRRTVNKTLLQRYNISNDEAYDLLKENKQSKVRSTIGQLAIEHSMPALRLQTPYYKTRLTVKEARSFHRPQLLFHIDQEIKFSKMKSRKRKHTRGKDIQTILNTTHDLSLGDNSNFVLLEYSEEHPTVMSNFGMGSRLINYYRRKGPQDESRPKYELGETQVLMPQDRSPFWNFGTVDPGEMVPTLYNRMIRAPIFKQPVKETDFLVVRSTDMQHSSRYFLRNIPNLYVVGQVFPVTEVPGPSSRKMTTVAKNRLKMVCYRLMKRKENNAISLKDIAPHFPESNDPQNRSKLKEFLQMNKEIGMWEVKSGETLPGESVIRAMVDPESVCLLEAMQVGYRHLQDAGYGKTVDEDDEDDDKQGSVEQMLAPWKTTKNFLHATQGKAMLKLHGEGDPSGRGEAFSFIRTSMKGGFKAIGESVEEKMDKARLKELGGHSYNVAKQQQAYEKAIEQIWKSQYKSLSSTEEHQDVDLEDAHRDEQMEDLFEEGKTPRSEAMTPAPWGNGEDETMSQFSRLSASSQRNKVLRIVRTVRGKDGKLEKVTEVVRDPKVIRQYLARKRQIDAAEMKIENFELTGDKDKDELQKKLIQSELSRLLRNKERREARERQGKRGSMSGTGPEDAMSPGVNSPGSPMAMGTPSNSQGGKQTSTTRKCANCGMVGHIRTNKKLCPKLNPALAGGGGTGAAGSPGPETGGNFISTGAMSSAGSFVG
ncbi:hypothetical protein BGX38DRAFT_1249132 [Terfezia claveryi]|nr:hypothetical protein BGX38DRAFT_1249132 [Terfezia claveryi]